MFINHINIFDLKSIYIVKQCDHFRAICFKSFIWIVQIICQNCNTKNCTKLDSSFRIASEIQVFENE